MVKLETLKNGTLKANVIAESMLRNINGGLVDTTYKISGGGKDTVDVGYSGYTTYTSGELNKLQDYKR